MGTNGTTDVLVAARLRPRPSGAVWKESVVQADDSLDAKPVD